MSHLVKYTVTARAFHWISAIMVFALFGLGVWMRTLDYYHPWYQPAPDLHKSAGILLVVLILARLVYRLYQRPPAPLTTHKPWEVKLAHATHFLLYGALAVIFVSGYLIATSEGRGIMVFDLFSVPALIEPFTDQEDIAGEIHEWVAYGLMGLVGLHIIGALKHKFIDKDDTVKRML